MRLQFLPLPVFLLITLSLASPWNRAIGRAPAPEPAAFAAGLPEHLLNPRHLLGPRQDIPATPTAYTTSRSANTEFAPPGATGTSYLETQTTTHTANTQIVVPTSVSSANGNGVTTDSRSANTQAVGPSTVSSTAGAVMAVQTGAVRMDRLVGMGVVAVGVAGLV